MSKRSWHLDRRELLRGCGAALTLPLLEAMTPPPKSAARPKRLVVTYISYGAYMPTGPSGVIDPWFTVGSEASTDDGGHCAVLARYATPTEGAIRTDGSGDAPASATCSSGGGELGGRHGTQVAQRAQPRQ